MWLAADIPVIHPKRAGVPGHTLTGGQVEYFNCNDSIIECFGEIDEMVPRGQDVSDMRGKHNKVVGQKIHNADGIHKINFHPEETYPTPYPRSLH